MQSFFLPLKQNSPYKWNFDVLLLVLRIIDNLLKSGMMNTDLRSHAIQTTTESSSWTRRESSSWIKLLSIISPILRNV